MFKRSVVLMLVIIAMLAMASGVQAASYTASGVTIETPNSYESCNPSDIITVIAEPGIVMDISAQYRIGQGAWSPLQDFYGESGTFTFSFPYPADTTNMQFWVSVWIRSSDPDVFVGNEANKWTVTCRSGGGEGCTPGYWKNHIDSWSGTGFSTTDDFDTILGVNLFNPNINLITAVNLGGGGKNALARHAVAALLNAASSGVDYQYSVAQVKSMVLQAYTNGNYEGIKNQFAYANEIYCPLN